MAPQTMELKIVEFLLNLLLSSFPSFFTYENISSSRTRLVIIFRKVLFFPLLFFPLSHFLVLSRVCRPKFGQIA